MDFEVTSIATYPIKGFAGITHDKIAVTKGGLLPGDRQFAISSGTAQSEQASRQSWLKKAHFLQTMTHADLARFDVSFTQKSAHLLLRDQLSQQIIFDGYLSDEADSDRLCQIIARHLGREATARLFHLADGAGMTDTKTPYVAFGNQASLSDFAQKAGIDDDARRYRLNVMLSGGAAFAENSLIGKQVRIGTAEFAFIEPVGRCDAIEVNPITAQRQKGLVQKLAQSYGAADMGVFATVTKSGAFGRGDKLIVQGS